MLSRSQRLARDYQRTMRRELQSHGIRLIRPRTRYTLSDDVSTLPDARAVEWSHAQQTAYHVAR